MVKFNARLYEIAPVVSIVLILLLPTWLRHDPAHVPMLGPEQKAVAKAVESVPFRIGRWVGRDVPIPDSAVQLLRPNAILSRRYTNLSTGITIDLIIVHCGDARDMLGHYPPVCYPNAGWVFADRNTERVERRHRGQPLMLRMHGHDVPVTLYEFTRMRDWSRKSHIRVMNFFVLPDGTLTGSIDEVSQRTNWLGASIHGVAQFQIVTNRETSIGDVVHGATELLEGMMPLMDALGVARDE